MKITYGLEAIRILLQYGLPALIVVGSWAFSFLLLRGMKRLQDKVVRTEQEFKLATATWTRSMAGMRKEIETIAEAAKHSFADSGASATRRKVLKMHRLGSSVEQIAKALRLSKGEVLLLLKVHTIILRPFEQTVVERETAAIEEKA